MSEKVQIFSTSDCPYCIQAKNLLTQRGVQFEEVQISYDDDAKWEELYQRTGLRTVPQIFHGNAVIGGYTDLVSLDKTDLLQSLKN